jgi:F-type H+-transporting ATPase subunit b
MEIHFDQILIQALNFGILLFVLMKFLYKPILKILEQRAEKIDAGLTAAQQNLEERQKLETTKKNEVKKAEIQASKIVEEAKIQAEKVAKEILEKAKVETSESIRREEAAFKARMEQQEKALVAQTSQMVMNVTKSVLKSVLTPAHQEEILNNEAAELKKLSLK